MGTEVMSRTHRQRNALTYLPDNWWSDVSALKEARDIVRVERARLLDRNCWRAEMTKEQFAEWRLSAEIALSSINARLADIGQNRLDETGRQLRLRDRFRAAFGADRVDAICEEHWKAEADFIERQRRETPPANAMQVLAGCGGFRKRKGEAPLKAGALVLTGYRDGST